MKNESIAQMFINVQRKSLKQVHNTKIKKGNMTYRISYEGGIAEYIGIYGKRDGAMAYRFVTGFSAYRLTASGVLDKANEIIQNL